MFRGTDSISTSFACVRHCPLVRCFIFSYFYNYYCYLLSPLTPLVEWPKGIRSNKRAAAILTGSLWEKLQNLPVLVVIAS